MKAAVYYQTGDPSVLKYEDVPDPVCGPRDILIDVKVVSLEGGDVLSRGAGVLATTPHCVGYQASGVIIEVGEKVKDRKIGQRVATVNQHGSHAEKRAVPANTSWVIPDNLSFEKAAPVPIMCGTAHDCVFEFGHLKKGETVLIHAGAGGVGTTAIQLAKRTGATVFATASSNDRLEKLKELGLDEGINYKEKDFVTEVKRLTNNKGVDLIIDPVSGEVLQKSFEALAYRGRIVTMGFAGRDFKKYNIMPLMQKNQNITGYYQGAEMASPRMQDLINRLLKEAASGELKILIDRKYPLAEAAAAHAYIESRQAIGRVLLIP